MAMKPTISEMIFIPDGVFERGGDECPDEQPVRAVRLASYHIDRYPVTNAEFRIFIDHGGYNNPQLWSSAGWRFATVNSLRAPLYWNDPCWNGDRQPVTGVSWWEAMAFARFVGKGLPTEAQWEYAARGSDRRRYPWGDAPPSSEIANFAPECEPSELRRRSTDVDAHVQNISALGCIDMAGNLAEWCLDTYAPNYLWDKDGDNPLMFTNEFDDHVARGGSGLHDEFYMRCSSRDSYPPSVRDNICGIRCVYPARELDLCII